jgi:hypothetical protein
MRFSILNISTLLFLCIGHVYAGNDHSQDSTYIKFLAGVLLINNATSLTPQQKAGQYTQLVRLTGISKDSATSYVSRYFNKPDDWKKLHEDIQNLLIECENYQKSDTIKTNTEKKNIDKKRSK